MSLDTNKHLTILVVENIDNMRSILSSMLTNLGFINIVKAHDGIEAIQFLKNKKIDIVLSSWELPKLNGLELLKHTRSQNQYLSVPFIMFTASIESQQVLAAIKEGVSEYLVKPFNLKILSQKLSKAITKPVKPTATKLSTSSGSSGLQSKSVNDIPDKLAILLVDDVAENLFIINEALKSEYKISAVTSGKKALKICQSENAPAIVLLDVMMPDMDGFEVCKQIKNNPQTSHIEVIFVTDAEKTHQVVHGLELGAIDYINKPIIPEILKARLKNHARLVRQQSQLRTQIDALVEHSQLRDELDRIMQNDFMNTVADISRFTSNIEIDTSNKTRVKANSVSIARSCDKLNNMINDLLTLFKLEDGSYQYQAAKVDLGKLYLDIIADYDYLRNEKLLEFDIKVLENASATADKNLVASIFAKLLINAIEAAPRGSKIDISTIEKNSTIVTCINNFSEIPAEIKDSLFEKYTTYGKKNSSGIGAYAAKLMVEVQGGDIRFESSSELGTSLYFTLPC